MDSSNAMLELVRDVPTPIVDENARPAAILRGTARGLEVVLWGAASVDAIALAIQTHLDKAPGFFRGSDVRFRVEEGPLAAGCLTRLDELARTFDLRIVEITAAKPAEDAVPRPSFAAGSAPANPTATPLALFEDESPTNTATLAIPEPVDPIIELAPVTLAEPVALPELPDPALEITKTAVPLALAATAESELATASETRIVVGPIRSGVILTHTGNLFIFGDVNPCAEVRATGNIVVLGRLRGTAHAGIGQDVAFVLALRLEPQQLRIGRMVARAADSDLPAAEAEIAYGTSDRIVVERYAGRLPRNLATSI